MLHGLHYVTAKKHAHKHLHAREGSHWKTTFDRFMYGVSVLAPLFLIPQLYEVWGRGNVAGVSIPTWGLLTIVNVLWLIYGLIHKEPPLIASGALTGIMNGMVVAGVILFR